MQTRCTSDGCEQGWSKISLRGWIRVGRIFVGFCIGRLMVGLIVWGESFGGALWASEGVYKVGVPIVGPF